MRVRVRARAFAQCASAWVCTRACAYASARMCARVHARVRVRACVLEHTHVRTRARARVCVHAVVIYCLIVKFWHIIFPVTNRWIIRCFHISVSTYYNNVLPKVTYITLNSFVLAIFTNYILRRDI